MTVAKAIVDVIWWLFPQDDENACQRWSAILAADERERAEAHAFAKDRAGFLAGRFLLRQCLATRLGIAPQAIALSRTDRGKPVLATGDPALAFGLTNAMGLVAVAIGRDCDLVGIDCEPTDSLLEPDTIHAFCAESEIQHIRQLPPGEAARAMLAHWTLKESYLKAIGVGLMKDPRRVEVAWQANAPVITHQGKEDRGWVHALHDDIGQHLLALAAHSDHGTPAIRIREFHDAETLAG